MPNIAANTLKWHKTVADCSEYMDPSDRCDSRKASFPLMAVKLLPLTHPWNLLAAWLSFFSLGSALRVQSDLARICNKNQHSGRALSK